MKQKLLQPFIPLLEQAKYAILKNILDNNIDIEDICSRLEVKPETFSRWLLSDMDLNLRMISDCAWALDLKIQFELEDKYDKAIKFNASGKIS